MVKVLASFGETRPLAACEISPMAASETWSSPAKVLAGLATGPSPLALLSVAGLTALVLASAGCGGDSVHTTAVILDGGRADASHRDSGGPVDAAVDAPDDDALDGELDVDPDAGDVDPDAPDLPPPVTFVVDSLQVDETHFSLGVQAGAMRSHSALLWTFVEELEPLLVRVWRPVEGSPGLVYLDVDEIIEPNADGYVKAIVPLPVPGEWYHYGFFRQSERVPYARSHVGRFRAALADGELAPVKVAATSCTNFRYAPYDSLRAMAAMEPDVFLHLGDMGYFDEATTLDEYRELWRRTLDDPGYRALLPSTGMYITWDDHEVDDNWDPETLDPDRVAIAKQAFFETLPVEEPEPRRLWNSYRWGDTVEFFVVDSRSERLPSTRDTEDAQYISLAQMEWLKEGLLGSQAHFKVILNSVPITDLPPLWLLQEDRWQGYPAQRFELVDHIVINDIRNVWFVTGDFHMGFIARVEPEGGGRRVWEIAAGPGANGPNPLPIAVEVGDFLEETIFPADQFEFWSSNVTVATTLTFDPVGDNVHILFVDTTTDEVMYEGILSERD